MFWREDEKKELARRFPADIFSVIAGEYPCKDVPTPMSCRLCTNPWSEEGEECPNKKELRRVIRSVLSVLWD
jgi:hypothetical protein